MRIGTHIDGRDLTYNRSSMQFSVGGTPVTLQQLTEYDAFGQIRWLNDEIRAWFLELREWMESSNAVLDVIDDEVEQAEVPTSEPSATVTPTETEGSARTAKPRMSPQAARWLLGTLAVLAVFVAVTVFTGLVECGFISVVLIMVIAVSVRKDLVRQSAATAMICPHCQTKGSVSTKSITQKKGVSGGKATAAIMTGGISMLATGLSRKEQATEAHCSRCGATWRF